jgi:transcriptional regulator with XRE-family HTH domain
MTRTYKKIKILLIENDITQVDLAKKIKTTPSYVNHIIHGNRKNSRIRRLIARELGCTVKTLFSDAA